MKIIKLLGVGIALFGLPAITYGAMASISVVEGGTGQSTISANAGDTVEVRVLLSTDTPLDGVQYSLSADNGGDQWILTDASQPPAWINGTVFAAGDYVGIIGTDPATRGVTLATANALGSETYLIEVGTTDAPLSSALLATYTLYLDPATPDGTYILSADGDPMGWGNGVIFNNGVDFTEWDGGQGLSIIVPEPGAGLLLVLALWGLRRRRVA